MSDEIEVRAPGKLYLFGEYAVLAGGRAVVAAADRYVTVRRRSEASTYRVCGADDDMALVEAVLADVEREAGRRWEPGRFVSDVGDLFEGGEKLGLGSSAASAVALTAVSLVDEPEELDDPDVRRRLFRIAEAAHRRFQNGQGSGGGVLAATFGGIRSFRRPAPTEPFLSLDPGESGGGREATSSSGEFKMGELSLPSSVEIRVVRLGGGASTRSFIGAVERQLALEPAPVYQTLRRIAGSADRAIEACSEDDAEAFREAARAGDRAMEQLGEVCGVPVVTAAHAALRQAVDSEGVVAKTSGAGGGEFALLVGSEETDWQVVRDQLPPDVDPIDVTLGGEGVQAAA